MHARSISLFFILLLPNMAAGQTIAQIKPDCITILPSDMYFLKSFNVIFEDRKKASVEHSFVLTKGTTYVIQICSDDSGDNQPLEFVIFDSDRNEVVTNTACGKPLDKIAYHCTSTGIFYLRYIATQTVPYYGKSILSFSRRK
jgi:hypothetical protein